MPRFFFHLHDEMDVTDDEGAELVDLDAATECAVQNVRAIASEQVRSGYLNLGHRIDVEDEAGQALATATFKSAVAVQG